MMIIKNHYRKFLLAILLMTSMVNHNIHAESEDPIGTENLSNSADYVIVGAGTAGSALAKRLSDAGFSVIVIEGGINEDTNPLITDPLVGNSLALNYTNEFFWPLGHSEVLPPELNPPPQNIRRWAAVTGELLGGGSSVNGMQYVRGDRQFFERWRSAAGGDPAWGPENATEVYKRLETFNGVPGQFNPAIHGFNGPVDIRQGSTNVPAAQQFINGVIALGLGYTDIRDYNDPNNGVGAFTYWQLTQQPNKQRESSSIAYLEPLRQRSSTEYVGRNGKLLIVTKAKAQRIIFDCECQKPEARGVLAVVDGIEKEYTARNEVILSAGFQSTLLLQLSGVGPGSRLRELGIPVVYDNFNVGTHAKNHPGFLLTGLGTVAPPVVLDPQALYTSGAFLSDPTRSDSTRAFELIGIATPPGAFTIATLLLDPLSEGFVTLYNSDPNRPPFFNFRQYSNPADLSSAVAAYGLMYQILLNMGLTPQGPLPGNTAAVIAYVTVNFQTSFQNYHYQSANIMSTSPATGVVDNNGRVFGVKNLRVADVSILPVNALGNTQAPAYLIGNVIADKIIDECHHRDSEHRNNNDVSVCSVEEAQ